LDKSVRSNKGTLGELSMTFNHLRMKGEAQAGRPAGGKDKRGRMAAGERALFAGKLRGAFEPRAAASAN